MGNGPSSLGYGSYLILLAVVMTASLALGLREGFKPTKPKPDATPLPTLSRKITVTCLGRLEPQGQMVRVAGPSGSSDSRIEWLAVSEGDSVEQGQIIARLDNFTTLQAAVEEARQEVLVSQARLGVTQAGARPSEIAAQRAEIARLEADLSTREASQQSSLNQLQIELANAETEFKRYQSLFLDGALSREEFERKQLALRLAQQAIQLNRSQAAQIVLPGRRQIEAARQKLRLLDEVRPEDVEQSRASVARSQSALASAQARLEQSRIRAPFRGTVLKLYSRIGEKVSASGLLDLGNTEQMDVIAEVYETETGRLKKGQLAKVSSDALPGRTLQGRLITLGQRIQRQNVINADPTSNIDERVMEVRIRLDRASSQQVRQLTNLQVKVELQIQ
jgi:HlyD family secretion protein